ncbi:MAG: hypothetical protein O2925_02710 [Actinomycetota bacterium]|jgi:hypothetical protein|nr:hypothetical protein [Actinomycetota bacterium]MDA3015265.1 hypothetical protein [Actinomycetota bacterium]MDA3027684.1 hypothetical protein [Actinomycetota bacterium]
MKRYPESAVWDEVAYLAYHLHWPLPDLLDLAHRDRVRLINIVAELNRRSIDTLRSV